jgi:hypothetical protein
VALTAAPVTLELAGRPVTRTVRKR